MAGGEPVDQDGGSKVDPLGSNGMIDAAGKVVALEDRSESL